MRSFGISRTCFKAAHITAHIHIKARHTKLKIGGASVITRGVFVLTADVRCGCGWRFNCPRECSEFGIGNTQMVLACTPMDALRHLMAVIQFPLSDLNMICSGEMQMEMKLRMTALVKTCTDLVAWCTSHCKVVEKLQ